MINLHVFTVRNSYNKIILLKIMKFSIVYLQVGNENCKEEFLNCNCILKRLLHNNK